MSLGEIVVPVVDALDVSQLVVERPLSEEAIDTKAGQMRSRRPPHVVYGEVLHAQNLQALEGDVQCVGPDRVRTG